MPSARFDTSWRRIASITCTQARWRLPILKPDSGSLEASGEAPHLASATILTDEAPAEWSREVDQLYFRGRPMENEVVFLHRPSRTLVMCDLAFNFGPNVPLITRLTMSVLGGYGRFRPTRLDPLLIRDRRAARESLERMLAWDFDRIVIAHGEVLESGGREALRHGYAWLLAG